MHKNILTVVGITILFLELGIQPVVAINSNSSYSEDDCDICPSVSNQHLIRLKSLINRAETLNNKLSILSKQYPEVKEKYQELSDRITTLQVLNEDSPICKILMIILLPVATIIFTFLFLLRDICYGKPIMSIIYTIIYIPIWFIAVGFVSILLLFDCIDLSEP